MFFLTSADCELKLKTTMQVHYDKWHVHVRMCLDTEEIRFIAEGLSTDVTTLSKKSSVIVETKRMRRILTRFFSDRACKI